MTKPAKVSVTVGFKLPYKVQFASAAAEVTVELQGDDPDETYEEASVLAWKYLNEQLETISERGPDIDGRRVTTKRRGPKRK